MKCKRENDGRKLSSALKEELRLRVVKRVEEGVAPEQLAVDLDINIRTIYKWLEKYHYGGEEALKTTPKPGRAPKLTATQLRHLAFIVRSRNPLQYAFDFALWTRGLIREVVRREFNVHLSEVSVGRILRRLGLSPQKPLYRAYQQDPKAVERWREEDYPAIKRRAKAEKALIFFADESGIRTDYHRGTTWGEVGNTPVVTSTGARFGLNMMSAVSGQGQLRFMIFEGSATAKTFCEFLTRLRRGVAQKIFLIVDGHPIHRAKMVKKHMASLDHQVTLFFLPPYSPQLNPDEWVWNHVKQRVAKTVVRTKGELKIEVLSALRSLQRLPKLIARFFQDKDCCYAA